MLELHPLIVPIAMTNNDFNMKVRRDSSIGILHSISTTTPTRSLTRTGPFWSVISHSALHEQDAYPIVNADPPMALVMPASETVMNGMKLPVMGAFVTRKCSLNFALLPAAIL